MTWLQLDIKTILFKTNYMILQLHTTLEFFYGLPSSFLWGVIRILPAITISFLLKAEPNYLIIVSIPKWSGVHYFCHRHVVKMYVPLSET